MSLLHHLREGRAKIASGALTLDQAARSLADNPEVGLTE